MLRNADWTIQTTLAPAKEQYDDLVMTLVHVTLAQPKEEREQYLRGACAQDFELFKEVWKYVEWEERMNGFLLDPLDLEPSSVVAFEPSELLDNRFRIVREVARGGMGVVYEAVDEKLGRRIAIKCAKPGFRRWLPPEVRHASEITHPGVCRIFEIHTVSTDHGEIDFLTMEFLEGETLAERLDRGAIPQKQAQVIAEQLCGGLAEAHRSGVIHGDLKSNNVILTSAADGTVRAVITDFGLARGHEANLGTIQSSSLRGTPDYMAPELWKGKKASVASDIYALGVILYELACGRKPFESLPELTWQDRLTRRPTPLRHPWRRIVERCLEPDPVRRWTSVSAIASAMVPSHRLREWTLAMVAALHELGVARPSRGGRFPVLEALGAMLVRFEALAHASSLRSSFPEAVRGLPGERRQVNIETAIDADGRATLAVCDRGDGVAAEVEGRLFDAFVTTKAGGLGLGLSICRSVIEAHGGSIGYARDAANGGARFAFQLPAEAA